MKSSKNTIIIGFFSEDKMKLYKTLDDLIDDFENLTGEDPLIFNIDYARAMPNQEEVLKLFYDYGVDIKVLEEGFKVI